MDNDIPDNDCGTDFEWWWQTVGCVEAEERRIEIANAMLQMIECPECESAGGVECDGIDHRSAK